VASSSNKALQRAAELCKSGQTKIRAGDAKGAFRDFEQAIAFAPQLPEPYINRAVLRIHNFNDIAGGIDDCNAALDINPDSGAAYSNRGVAYFKQEQYEKAAEDFHEALMRQPLEASLHRLKAYAHYELEQYAAAVQHYSVCLRFWHEPALCHEMRGVCYYNLHDFEKALEDLNASIESNPDRASAYTNRGVLYLALGDTEKALADQNKAVSLREYAGYYSNRGLVYLLRDELDEALNESERALSLDPHFADAHGLRGQIAFVQGDYEMALENFQQLELYKMPGDLHAQAGQSIALYALGRTDDALDMWQAIVWENGQFRDLAWLKVEFLLAAPLLATAEQILKDLEDIS
jgi:tetratricopeptide (TPR) repeat protein